MNSVELTQPNVTCCVWVRILAHRACLVAAFQAARQAGSTIRPQADEIGRLGLLPGPGSFVRV